MAVWRRRKLNSLGLAGDGDDVAILEDVERVFGIRILDSEAVQLRKVGQLHDLILAKLPVDCFGPHGCLSAGAFYRLRAALGRIGNFGRMRPGTSLSELIGRNSVRRFWRRLERESGLRLPGPFHGDLSAGLIFLCLLLFPVGWALGAFYNDPAFLLLWLVSIAGFLLDAVVLPLTFPARFATLGGLARGAAYENFRRLADERRTYRPEDIWNTLDYLIRKETGTELPINGETVFFDADHP